jgi:hypothetical protein
LGLLFVAKLDSENTAINIVEICKEIHFEHSTPSVLQVSGKTQSTLKPLALPLACSPLLAVKHQLLLNAATKPRNGGVKRRDSHQ